MRFAQGPCRDEEEKLESLMATYGTQVKRLCCLYLRDASLAEDAAQETFIKAWRSLASFRGESSERTWLMRIAVNTCRDALRTSWFRRLDRALLRRSCPSRPPGRRSPPSPRPSPVCLPATARLSSCAITSSFRRTRSRTCSVSR